MRTQVKASYRIKGREHFYVDADGNRNRIPVLLPAGLEHIEKTINTIDKNRNDIYIFGEGMGETAIDQPDYRKYMTFIVSEAKDIEEVLRSKYRVINKALSNASP